MTVNATTAHMKWTQTYGTKFAGAIVIRFLKSAKQNKTKVAANIEMVNREYQTQKESQANYIAFNGYK